MSSASVLSSAQKVLDQAKETAPTATPGTPEALGHEYSGAPYSLVSEMKKGVTK